MILFCKNLLFFTATKWVTPMIEEIPQNVQKRELKSVLKCGSLKIHDAQFRNISTCFNQLKVKKLDYRCKESIKLMFRELVLSSDQ